MKPTLRTFGLIVITFVMLAPCARGDILELKDGTVMIDCYVRDEGTCLLVWETMDKVGTTDYRVIPRSQLAKQLSQRYTAEVDGQRVNLSRNNWCLVRDDSWDVQPQLQDLSVTFIEMNPKLAGLHGKVNYDELGACFIANAPVLDKRVKELGDKKKYLDPEYIVQDLKLKYEAGEEITFTAHVKNFGFVTAKPFEYRWYIDDKEVQSGKCSKSLEELGETTFTYKYKWEEGKHTVGFEVVTNEKEIATINNKATDAMWAWAYFYMVTPEMVKKWHSVRMGSGTFSWEDYYRWHVDIMNHLFAASIYPAAPNGIQARVRIDRIIYMDEINDETAQKALIADDGINYSQGGWTWRVGDKVELPRREDRNSTEWSLPHELGHQLGLVDYYAIDYDGTEDHVWPDNKERVRHFQNHPDVMMHSHGPNLYSQLSAVYFNQTWDKPRGYFGDHYYEVPDECFLNIVDVNGKGVPNAKVECFQRGTDIDPKGKPGVQQGVTWYPVIEDGNFEKLCPKLPVIVGQTDKDGVIRLPNRPAFEVRSLNGFHRKDNPWGNINVVGGRGLMLVQVTIPNNPPAFFYLEAIDFTLAALTGHKEKYVVTLETPFGSVDSPNAPINIRWQYTDATKKKVKVTWQAPQCHERETLEIPIGYRVYRRDSDMALNDKPWYAVATTNPETFEAVIDIDETSIQDVNWFTSTIRFAVSSVAQIGIESAITQAQDANPQPK